MQAQNRQKISPNTVEALMNRVYDPRRLGGHTRAIGLVNRSEYGKVYTAFFNRDLKTPQDLHDFFSTMLEEEALRLLELLGARMPDLTVNTTITVLHGMTKAA